MTSSRRLNRFRTFGYRAGDPWVHNRVVAERRRRRRAAAGVVAAVNTAAAEFTSFARDVADSFDRIVVASVLSRGRALGLSEEDASELVVTHRKRGRSWSEVEQLMVEHAVFESRLPGGGLL